RVGAVREFERPGKQVFFPDRLRAVARVDARRSEEQEALRAAAPGFVDDVRLHLEVGSDEIRGIVVVREDAAYFGRRDEDELWPFLLEELTDRLVVGEIELGVGPSDEVPVAVSLEAPHQSGARKAAVAGDVDARAQVHRRSALCYSCAGTTEWPWRSANCSRSASSRSARTISATSSEKRTLGFQPSLRRAFAASPSRLA